MAKTLKLLDNGLRVKYLVKEKRYYLFFGSRQCKIDCEYQRGFYSQEAAEIAGKSLFGEGYSRQTREFY